VLALEGERQRKTVEALIDNPHFSNDDHVALAEAAMSGMLDFVDPDRYPHYARKLERELAKAREEARKEAREEAREEARVEAFLEVLRSLDADQASAIEAMEDPAARQQAAWDALQAALGQRGQG
jgi:DNA/RNA-binding domain of Phe-tRNA-synthetase-like protein